MSLSDLRRSPDWIGIGFALVAAGASALAPIPSHADEAYLCEDKRIVYVGVADLERMKRSDPCIAAYYGLKVEHGAAKPQGAGGGGAAASSLSGERKAEAPSLRRLADAPRKARDQRKQLALSDPPVATPGTDFRHVRILNPSDPADAIFIHTR